MYSLMKLCRPHQYIKNAFVFMGPFFCAPHLLPEHILIKSFICFIAFCFASSSVYICNDIKDVEEDRAHPTKRHRPLASGVVSLQLAILLAATLCGFSLLISAISGSWVLLFIIIYFLINVGYCLRWKHIPLVDVFLISGGFMMRILAGTIGLGISPSSWLLLCGFMLTIFLGFSKRLAELLVIGKIKSLEPIMVRQVLDQYSPRMIEQFTSISAACVIVSYSLYTVSPETVDQHHTTALIYTVPFVVYGIFRYLFRLQGGVGGNDTARDLVYDRHLLVTGIFWIVLTGGVIFWAR